MNIFLNATKYTINLIKKDPFLMKRIEHVSLIGSVADREAIPHYSDIDLVVIPKANEYGRCDLEVIAKLKTIARTTSSKYDVKLSLLTFSRNDLENFVNEEILTHFSSKKTLCTYGPTLKQICGDILQEKDSSLGRMRVLMANSLRKSRFDLIRKYVSANEFNTYDYVRTFGRELIDQIFQLSDWCLIYNNIWSMTKREIVQNIVKNYSKKLDVQAIREAYKIRKHWNDITDNELENYFPSGVQYISQVIELVIKQHISK